MVGAGAAEMVKIQAKKILFLVIATCTPLGGNSAIVDREAYSKGKQSSSLIGGRLLRKNSSQ